MKVSVIVTTRNRAHLVGATIDSILKQTFQDFELIVVDDCSEDDTEKAVRAFNDSRIRYFKNDSGRLVAVNRNYGMSRARGEFIAFCDDDDLWLPEKLEIQLAEFEKDGNLGMVCSNGVVFNDEGDLGIMFVKSWDNYLTYDSILKKRPVRTPSVVLKKIIIDNIGGMNTNPVFYVSEDYEFWLRIARKKYKILYLDLPLWKYRKHTAQLHMEGFTSPIIKLLKPINSALYAEGLISRGYYWRRALWLFAIELLLLTRTMPLASWLWRSIRRVIRL
jgi:teichuronic acid biosynthesis glycosyltransferase TuaG